MSTRLRPTIRLRLAALYALVFLVSGAVLLTGSYVYVRHNLLTDRAAAERVVQHRLSARGRSAPRNSDRGSEPGDLRDQLVDAARLQLRTAALRRLIEVYALALVITTIASALLGWLMAGRALRPLSRITTTARRVSQENLHERIDLQGPADELRELADTFDSMLERLDRAFASQRSFVANASHELRTPLAIIRTEVDVALQSDTPSAERLVATAIVVRTATERSERIIDGLLALARSDRGDVPRAPVRIDLLVAHARDELADAIAERALTVETELEPVTATGDRALLDRVVANLLQNAVRHNVHAGWITIRTTLDSDRARLTVANGGARIVQADADTLTTPFRRLASGPRVAADGVGLGLSIVESVVQAHGGRLWIEAPGEGLVVTVELPAVAGTGGGEKPRVARAVHGLRD